jgi:hypothetical protein
MAVLHTHEKIIGIRYITPDPEQLHEVMELSVYVATYLTDMLSAT